MTIFLEMPSGQQAIFHVGLQMHVERGTFREAQEEVGLGCFSVCFK